ncbi:major facilitator superfamily domain-containing protein [Scenedesmus sp. NREL 46B-D3]|nr:major facilitator superfamily domain-containing protein [Scenedesmus sp. NREL 46B-D3]
MSSSSNGTAQQPGPSTGTAVPAAAGNSPLTHRACAEHSEDKDAAADIIGQGPRCIPSSNSRDCSPSSGSGSSIYDLMSPRRRHSTLLVAAFASMLVPFSDTVYLPALQVIQADLATSPQLVAASVSIYMVLAGLASLVWGPASDRYGRRVVYVLSAVAFLGATFGCIFAPSASALVAFRALQGAGVAAFMTNGNGVIADIYPPSQRGAASGAFMVPLLIGPVIGPLLGGGLSGAFGWRSTFMALAAYGALAAALILACVPETHQYFVLRRLAQRKPAAAQAVKEREAIEAEPPVLHAPWVPLKYLFEPAICPHAVLAFVTFGTNFAALTESPGALVLPPYSLTPVLIGVTFLADGISGLIGSPIGGWVSDRAAARHPGVPEARLLLNTQCTLAAMPAGLLLYGWALQRGAHLALVVLGQVLIGWACAVCLAGVFGFLTTMKQTAAAAAAAMVQTLMFVSAGILIIVSAVVTRAIGYGAWFSVLGVLQLLASAAAYAQIVRRLRAHAASAGDSSSRRCVDAESPPSPGVHSVTA